MKTEIGQVPENGFVIQTSGLQAYVFFYENPVELKREDSVSFECDMYRLSTRNRPNLEADIEKNYDKWLNAAKEEEGISPKPTIDERVTTVEETIDTIFGGIV